MVPYVKFVADKPFQKTFNVCIVRISFFDNLHCITFLNFLLFLFSIALVVSINLNKIQNNEIISNELRNVMHNFLLFLFSIALVLSINLDKIQNNKIISNELRNVMHNIWDTFLKKIKWKWEGPKMEGLLLKTKEICYLQ